MKEAMWGLGVIALSVFGFLLINTFGNITVTNQFNYSTMKNVVEAAMYDARDIPHYRTGFCLCSSKEKVDDKWIFENSSEYTIVEPDNSSCPIVENRTCELLEGEYKIDKKVFSESLVRRFAEMVGNNKDYQIIIQDIIEYPPKVSVAILSQDSQALGEGEFTITNQIDAILESNTPSNDSDAGMIKVNVPSPVRKEFNGTVQGHGIAIPEGVNIVEEGSTVSAMNVGKYEIVLRPGKNYYWRDGSSGTKKVSWEIYPYDISCPGIENCSRSMINGIEDVPYTGDPITQTPNIVVPIPDSKITTMIKDVDYTLTKNQGENTPGSEYKFTIQGKNNYTGTRVASFKVIKQVNIMTNLNSFKNWYITKISFINSTRQDIDNRYNSSSTKADVTLAGNVKAWIEGSTLYVGSVGTTYFSNGSELFMNFRNVKEIDFKNASTQLIRNYDKSMAFMFALCTNLTTLTNFNINTFSTYGITDMGSMFNQCSSISSLNLSHFDTSRVTNMIGMFLSCTNLNYVNLSSFDTSNVTSMTSMFSHSYYRTSIDLSSFNTAKVTDMHGLFENNYSLTVVYASDKFVTTSVQAGGMNRSAYQYGYSDTDLFRGSGVKHADGSNCSSLGVASYGGNYRVQTPYAKVGECFTSK